VFKRLVAILSAAGLIAAALFVGSSLSGMPEQRGHQAQSVVMASDTPTAVESAADSAPPGPAGVSASVDDHDNVTGRWGIERIAVPAAWHTGDSFAPVLVAVLDTGIASDAPFAHRIVASMDFGGEGTTEDTHGHGTHMAGTIAAIAPNANLLNVKVADGRGRCETDDVARALRWAADSGAQIINVSLEVAPSDELEQAVDYALERGALVVAAAGNGGSTAPAYPAAYVSALAVAGTNESDGLAVLSNHGQWVDIAAPGFKIYAEQPGGEFGYETGTSPAAAHVSGVAALLCGLVTDTSGNGAINDEVRSALLATAQPLTIAGAGSGIVDASAAVRTLLC
jgi:thermitase